MLDFVLQHIIYDWLNTRIRHFPDFMLYIYIERERERETERQRERERERETDRQTDRQRKREREKDRKMSER